MTINMIPTMTTIPSRFRTAMTEAGFTVAGEEHAICPVIIIIMISMMLIILMMITMALSQVMLWDEQLNQEMAKLMLAEGVLVIPLRFFRMRMDVIEFRQKRAGKQPTEQLNQTSECTQSYCILIR